MGTLSNMHFLILSCLAAAISAFPQIQPYVHEDVAALPYIHEEVLAEPYIHEEPELSQDKFCTSANCCPRCCSSAICCPTTAIHSPAICCTSTICRPSVVRILYQ